jgi:methyl-accepting chemotaxis protein
MVNIMKGLKVSHKVIFGFSTILLLLLFTSISSIRILNDIDSATNQVGDFAMPVQNLSNKIQILLLKQAKLSSLIPGTFEQNKLDSLKVQFSQTSNLLQQQTAEIKRLLSSKKENKHIQQFDSNYLPYLATVEQIFANKVGIIEKTQQINVEKDALIQSLRSIEDQLVNLSYIEEVTDEELLEQISSASIPIESYIIGMAESIQNINTINDFESLTSFKDTLEIGVNNTIPLFDFLKRLTSGNPNLDIVDDIIAEFKAVGENILSDKGVINTKQLQIEQIVQLEQLFITSEQQAELSVQSIDQLLLAFDKKVNQLQATVFNNIDQGQTTTWVLLTIIFIVGASISFFTVRSMSVPLIGINQVLASMAKGDLSKQLIVKSDDEYGMLSKNINLVVADLRTLVGQISTNSHSLNSAAKLSSSEISSVVELLEQQQQTVDQMTQVTNQLNSNADQVLSQAKTAEQEMSEALLQSDDLKGIANTTSEHITILANGLDDTSDIMAILQQQSNNIGGIIETIQGIADQTNLLALNAAIEAARAGETGRGFAVVADEVRGLASRTQEATAEINTMITSLQQQTKKAVSDLNNGKNEANECRQYTDTLLNTLAQINQAIEQMHKMSLSIAESANEQNSLSNEINTNINDVVQLSKNSNDKSISTLSYNKEVADLTKKLEKSVDEFNI